MAKRHTVKDIVDGQSAAKLIKKYGSPLYIYSQKIIKQKVEKLLKAAHGFDIRYALKANSNSSITKLIKSLGVNGVDVVSPGQLFKALQCGYKPEDIMFTQNFISSEELDYVLENGVTLNIGALETLAHHKDKLKGQNIYIRINPKIGAGPTYHVITGGPKSKFGVYEDSIDEFIKIAKENDIHIKGVHQHIGSNMNKNDHEVFLQTLEYVVSLLCKFQEIEVLNIGGGLGVAYMDSEQMSDPQQLYNEVREIVHNWEVKHGKSIKVAIEPGRYLVAESSALLCTITARKTTPQRRFFGTDTGFNHLIRPALYGSHHEIVNLTNTDEPTEKVSVCGNICECTDIFAIDIKLSGKIGDILAIENTGAYGYCMSSNYNERPRPAQVMLNLQNEDIVIRKRQTFKDLLQKL